MRFEIARNDWIQMITDIIGFIINLFSPILFPIGELMGDVFDFIFNFFPYNILWVYIIIAIGLVAAGLLINIKYPGIEYTSVFQRIKEEEPQEQPSEAPEPEKPSEEYEPYND